MEINYSENSDFPVILETNANQKQKTPKHQTDADWQSQH